MNSESITQNSETNDLAGSFTLEVKWSVSGDIVCCVSVNAETTVMGVKLQVFEKSGVECVWQRLFAGDGKTELLDNQSLLLETLKLLGSDCQLDANPLQLVSSDPTCCREWRVRAAGPNHTNSGWAWDVMGVRFLDESGVVLTGEEGVANGNAFHSGCASDREHGGYDGYEPMNAFRNDDDDQSWWGGRAETVTGEFYLGWRFVAPVKVATLRMLQFGLQDNNHYAPRVAVECREASDGKWVLVKEFESSDYRVWQTFQLG